MTRSYTRVTIACDRCRSMKLKCTEEKPCPRCESQKLTCSYSKPGGASMEAAQHQAGTPDPNSSSSRWNNPNNSSSRSSSRWNNFPNSSSRWNNFPVGYYSDSGPMRPRNHSHTPGWHPYSTSNSKHYKPDQSTSHGDLINPVRHDDALPDVQSMCQYLPGMKPSELRYRVGITPKCSDIVLLSLCNTNRQISAQNAANDEGDSDFKMPRGQHYAWNMSGVRYLKLPLYPPPPSIDMSQYHNDLVSTYKREINSLFSVLNQDFFQYLENSDRNGASSNLTSSQNTSTDANDRGGKFETDNKRALLSAITHLVYALSIRMQQFSKASEPVDPLMLEIEEICFEYALEVIQILTFHFTSADIVRAWLLTTLYLRMCHRQKTLSYALGQANLTAKYMGLHREDIPGASESGSDNYAVFWCVYSFDQMFSLQVRSENFWSSHMISVPFPDEYSVVYEQSGFSRASFALLKVSCLANQVLEFRQKPQPDLTIHDINRDLQNLHAWLKTEGFDDLEFTSRAREFSPLVRAQVMLNFHDVVCTLHGPLLLNYTGLNYPNMGLSSDFLLSSMKGIIQTSQKLRRSKLLQSPYYLTLVSIFTVGSFALAMINGGVQVQEAQRLYDCAMDLAEFLASFGETGHGTKENGVIKDGPCRFQMAKEAIWALSQGHKSLMARFNSQIHALPSSSTPQEIDSVVNESRFGDLGTRVSKRVDLASNGYGDRQMLNQLLPPVYEGPTDSAFDALDWMSSLTNEWPSDIFK